MDSNSPKNNQTSNSNDVEHSDLSTQVSSQVDPSKDKSPELVDIIAKDNSEAKSINDTIDEDKLETSEENKNDTSTFSTAFTISFEDDNNTSKKLGIRDSIRKFAPPKPHTIEKPRQPKNEPDTSLMSVESAPGISTTKQFVRRTSFNSNRSSGRKSTSSRHSNLSESAAFLIDKMLHSPSKNLDQVAGQRTGSDKSEKIRLHSGGKKISSQSKRKTLSSDDILDSDIDYCEDKSDNGTYIVDADPESEVARKKIDELFGVVRAAEESVKNMKNQKAQELMKANRLSRLDDKKAEIMNRERADARVNAFNRNSSRSSSSSRHDNISSSAYQQRQPRASSHRSRNSSCDRTTRQYPERCRRSVSQSSRQSSNKEVSDNDTRSSRSSLHIEGDAVNQDLSPSNHPSMKFNRAFALRRARLGLGEPVRAIPSTTLNYGQDSDLFRHNNNNINLNQRRQLISNNPYKSNQQTSLSGSANFCRDDGGRYSLRMKNAPPTRLSSAHQTSSRVLGSQHSNLVENYLNKVSKSKFTGNSSPNVLASQQLQDSRNPAYQFGATSSSTLAYQNSGDELEMNSPKYQQNPKIARSIKKGQVDLESDSESNGKRFNYQSGLDNDNNYYSLCDSRAGSANIPKRGGIVQIDALDSLVVSAISDMSRDVHRSVCEVLVDLSKRLPANGRSRLILEEILPARLSSSSKSPISIEEIDQSLCFDLKKTFDNLKSIEKMVNVIKYISEELSEVSISNSSDSTYNHRSNSRSNSKLTDQSTGNVRGSNENTTNSESNSVDLSPV